MKRETHFAPELQPVSHSVFRAKHALPHETCVEHVFARVARGLAEDSGQKRRFYRAMLNGFVPGGRIMKGSGREQKLNLINCFVQPIADSIHGSVSSQGSNASQTNYRFPKPQGQRDQAHAAPAAAPAPRAPQGEGGSGGRFSSVY